MSDKYIIMVYYISKLLIELINEHKNNRQQPEKL